MGKKVKKDEKAPPEDVFDTILVESRQAATVVLMLSSPEEDVQSKACEAIYKFVDKCDENKKTLMDLGAIEPLLKLMGSEDRIARRNACMALSTMCANSDVRKFLRKREESIPKFVALLVPEEDTVVHEFAALGLSALATEFTSKVVINESNGVEPLVRCLSSNDPDVQKNAIEALAQLMMDYQTRATIRDFDGLNSVLELLKSEFSIIQKLALLTLERAAQDVDNRANLRELEAISKLINFLAHPEWNDLHVMSVMVLSSLLEDIESLEQIKETGGLKKLVAIITDQAPPEEETKKPDKKPAGKGGKKSAKESAKKPAEESNEQKDGEGVIPTLPDVKMSAAKAIARSARNSENRKILHEQEAEKMLIILLSHENVDVQSSAAQALAIMCENLSSRDSVREMEGMAPLIKLLNSENGDVKEAATLALANLTTANLANSKDVVNLNGLEPLIHMLSDQREEAVSNAACVLTNIAQDDTLRAEALNKGAVTALVEPLKSSNTIVQSKAALASAAYLCDVESRTEFREAGGLEPLIDFLDSGNDDVRRSAAWAITVCGVDEASAVEICKLGGLGVLQQIQLSETKRTPFTDAALYRILDSNLSAKYSLTGYIGYNNLIEDGFYDAGQMKKGSKFLSLEEFCNQELNDKRPVILINPKPEVTSAESKTEDVGLKPESSKTSLSGKSSRTGRESKSKTKAQKEKEEKQKEELQAQLQKEADAIAAAENLPFVTPADPVLLAYIDEVMEKIQPLPSSREQVIALSEFVSDKLGGSIDRGQVSSFSWELPVSQVRYELKSNVIPIGRLKTGIHIHRALLFKVLADRIALSCTLVRGQYNRAWNEVMLYDIDDNPTSPKFPPKEYIVDLIHQPGTLLPVDTPNAVSYQKI
ncbi:armadillo repeat-containing protein 3 [Patella vulgata]|uniref:armadillo repeat-containing protein 3 n=1 Tax=Patella vulgata TaxID=6465 RepID=UPI002180514D|nr:armadillo repeat-containing protein 3 [Patella vulgata]